MRTQHLLSVLSPGEVASILNIKVQAVYQWPKDKEVPALRQYQLREYLTANDPEKLSRLDAPVKKVRPKTKQSSS